MILTALAIAILILVAVKLITTLAEVGSAIKEGSKHTTPF